MSAKTKVCPQCKKRKKVAERVCRRCWEGEGVRLESDNGMREKIRAVQMALYRLRKR